MMSMRTLMLPLVWWLQAESTGSSSMQKDVKDVLDAVAGVMGDRSESLASGSTPSADPNRKKWTRCSAAEQQAPPRVISHGCYAESWPRAFKAAYDGQGTIWRAHSPVECACMCKMRYGELWTGFVAIEAQSAACNCLLQDSASAAGGWSRRGAMRSRCCMKYHPETRSLGYRENLGCPDIERTSQNDPGKVERAARGETWTYNWVQSVFEVVLCNGVCGTSAVAGGQCPSKFGTLDWAHYALCASGEGAHYHCNIDGGGKVSQVRIGARSADGSKDVAININATAAPYLPNLAKMWGRTEGLDCSFTAILHSTVVQSGKRALDFWAGEQEWRGEHLKNAAAFTALSPAEASSFVSNSLHWMCENAALMSEETFQCWWKLREGEKMMEDCTPPSGAAPEITREVQACAAKVKVATSRVAQAAIGRAFVQRITSHLATEIVANMKAFCPDIKALQVCVSGLLPKPSEKLPQDKHFVLPPGSAGASSRDAIAFIIPYRERPVELRKWIWWTLPLLLTPQADGVIQPFGIFIAEEMIGPLWNKARILNAATREVRALSPLYECLVYVDVDLVMQAPKSAFDAGFCLYGCNHDKPVHYSSRLLGYAKPHDAGPTSGVFCNPTTCSGPPSYRGGQSSGGVNALTFTQFEKINGWTNEIWGWGGEDGDFDKRIKAAFRDAPLELSTIPGNEQCVFVHLIDRDSDSKGEIGMAKAGAQKTKLSGYREVASRYKLLRTEWHALYTTFLIDPLPSK